MKIIDKNIHFPLRGTNEHLFQILTLDTKTAKLLDTKKEEFLPLFCGAYETRTRDPMRDRHVF